MGISSDIVLWDLCTTVDPILSQTDNTQQQEYNFRKTLFPAQVAGMTVYYKSTINWHLFPRKKYNWSGGKIRSWITFHIFIRHFHA